MTETLTKDDIKEMVSNFIRAYATEMEKTSLPEANQFADDFLLSLSRDLTEEQSKTFVELAAPEVHKLLRSHLVEEETDGSDTTD